MNEAGALYILPGSSISRHKDFSISDEEIVKILGRQMSQLAPPFHHWDFTDFNFDGHADIIVTADNDMCSGLHAGSVQNLMENEFLTLGLQCNSNWVAKFFWDISKTSMNWFEEPIADIVVFNASACATRRSSILHPSCHTTFQFPIELRFFSLISWLDVIIHINIRSLTNFAGARVEF